MRIVRSAIGQGYIERDLKMDYWRVFRTPIAEEAVGGFDKPKGKYFVGCAYGGRFFMAESPYEIVDQIIQRADRLAVR